MENSKRQQAINLKFPENQSSNKQDFRIQSGQKPPKSNENQVKLYL
jgi:hypothetical protein